MSRPSLAIIAMLAFVPSAIGQESITPYRSVRPITGNILERSVRIDPQTGRAVRLPAGAIHNDGLSTVYDNTCPTYYFFPLNTTIQNGPGSTQPMAFGDWGMLPSTAAPTGVTCTAGNADTYQITQFVCGYCTSDGVAIDAVFNFWNAPQNACVTPAAGGPGGETLFTSGGPPPVATINVVGLPRSSAASPNSACYVVQVAIDAPGFDLDGGTAGLRTFGVNGDRFHWSMQVTTGTGGAGPILAGNANFGSPCNFCLGTIWEVGSSAQLGIGLGQANMMALESFGGSTPYNGDCYSFGGNPWAGGYLILDAYKPGAVPTSFCDASDGSLVSCPCANPGALDTGCDNAQATGGVRIDLVTQDTVQNKATITATGFPTGTVTLTRLMRSPSTVAPVVFGDGVRCLSSGGLAQYGIKWSFGGTLTQTITHSAGSGTFYYQIRYKNFPTSFCDPFSNNNLSNGMELVW